MQIYDLIMLLVIVGVTLLGAIKGFAWQLASLASIVVSYFVAYRFRNEVAQVIKAQPPWNLYLAMLLLYVGTSFGIWVVFRLISGTIDRVRLKEFDRHLGALFGFGKGVIYCLIITMFAVTLLGPNQQKAICQSRSGYYIGKILASADGIILPAGIEKIVRPQLEQLEQKLKQGGAAGGGLSNTSSSLQNQFGFPQAVPLNPVQGQGTQTVVPWFSSGANNATQVPTMTINPSTSNQDFQLNDLNILPGNNNSLASPGLQTGFNNEPSGGFQSPTLRRRQADRPASPSWQQ